MVRQVSLGGTEPTVQNVVREVVRTEATCRCDPALLDVPMIKPATLGGRASGLFNPNPGAAGDGLDLLFRRVEVDGGERFRLLEAAGYWDTRLGGIIVPECLADFDSDFATVPTLFTWLIPRSGQHLPAAVIHDGLVNIGRDEQGRPVAKRSYVVSGDAAVPRTEADRVFRDALRDLRVPWLRRWLMWTAVTTGTFWEREPSPTGGPGTVDWRRRFAGAATIGVVLVLGAMATVDLLDWREWVWWMPEGPWYQEVAGGALGAVVVPGMLSLLWWPQARAGFIAGVALAFLLHVTVALFVVSSAYLAAENAVERTLREAARWGAAAVLTVAAVVGFLLWAHPG